MCSSSLFLHFFQFPSSLIYFFYYCGSWLYKFFLCCLFISSLCLSFSSACFLRLVWFRRIVRWTTVVLRSHPAIDCLPVVAIFIFFCCSTLFAIAFLCDLKYVQSVSVFDFKNVFKCTKRKSSSGRAFCFNRCSFRISNYCSCRRLKLSLFLLLFSSSPWTSQKILHNT